MSTFKEQMQFSVRESKQAPGCLCMGSMSMCPFERLAAAREMKI